MSQSELIGGMQDGPTSERQGGGDAQGLGARLVRFLLPPSAPEASPAPAGPEPQDTVEFVPEYAGPEEDGWTPRFAMAWRGYDRAAVDEHIRALEDELTAVRAERTPEHAIREEIDRIGDDTAAILRVAREKADAITTRAEEQADLLASQAQAGAKAVTESAEQRLRKLDADTDAVWRDRARLIDDTRRLADNLLAVADDAAERFPPEVDDSGDSVRAARLDPPADPPGEADQSWPGSADL